MHSKNYCYKWQAIAMLKYETSCWKDTLQGTKTLKYYHPYSWMIISSTILFLNVFLKRHLS
jgi:hypothetical protein